MKVLKMISLFSIVLSQNLFAKSGVIPAGNTIWECVTANKYFRITASQDIETRNFGTLIFDENQEFQVQSLGENDRRSFSATLIFQKIGVVTKHAPMATYKLVDSFGEENLTLTLGGIDELVRKKCSMTK